MKIVKSDFDKGFARVVLTNELDLWHLENLIEVGDLITAKTLRSIFLQREERKEKVKKRLVRLKLKVEKIYFQKHRGKLRFVGKIVECPKDVQKGSYHTIEATVGSKLIIEKKLWKKEHIERLEKAKYVIKVSNPRLIQEFFIHVNKNDTLAVYGVEQVKIAANIGAVRVVLIPEERLKEFEDLIKKIEEKRGEIRLISKKFSSGKKFLKTYDIGAILRFPIS